MMISKLSHLK